MIRRHSDKLFYPVMLSVLSGSILVLIMLVVSIFPFENILVRLTLPVLLALTGFPYLIEQYRKSKFVYETPNKGDLIIVSSFIAIMYFTMKTQTLFFMSIHFLVAAFSEEYLYRKIIFDDIRENYNVIVALIISSFLFAIIGHMGEEIINNLLYRFPLGVVFCCIKIKFKKLIYPTIIHATYNICISIM